MKLAWSVSVDVTPSVEMRRSLLSSKVDTTNAPVGSIVTPTGLSNVATAGAPSSAPAFGPPVSVVTTTFERNTMLSGRPATAASPPAVPAWQPTATPPAPPTPATSPCMPPAPPPRPPAPATPPAAPPRPPGPSVWDASLFPASGVSESLPQEDKANSRNSPLVVRLLVCIGSPPCPGASFEPSDRAK